jgi:hypothetical protein
MNSSAPIRSLVLRCGHGFMIKIILEAEGRATVSPGVEGRCPLTKNGGLCGMLLNMGYLDLTDQNGQVMGRYVLSASDGRKNA